MITQASMLNFKLGVRIEHYTRMQPTTRVPKECTLRLICSDYL